MSIPFTISTYFYEEIKMAEYIISKIDGKEYCYTNGHFARHLVKNNIDLQTYYNTYIFMSDTPTCPYCNERGRTFNKTKKEYKESCGKQSCINGVISNAHLNRSQEDINKSTELRKSTCLDKYGVEFVMRTDEFKEKVIASLMEVQECGRMNHEIIAEKRHATCMEKYGNAYYNNGDQISATKQEFTVEKNNAINEKRSNTNLERYGVSNNLMNHDLQSKIGTGNATPKQYVMPSGNLFTVRGHEPIALDELMKTYKEDDILIQDETLAIINRPPIIKFTTKNGRNRTYYPDIYIKSENKLIEVKSEWWFCGNWQSRYKDRLEINIAKMIASVENGYNYEVWLYDGHGKNKKVISMNTSSLSSVNILIDGEEKEVTIYELMELLDDND